MPRPITLECARARYEAAVRRGAPFLERVKLRREWDGLLAKALEALRAQQRLN